MATNPFPDVSIADWTFLETESRSHCPKCRKSRKYYCYNCFIPLPQFSQQLPKVKLPLKVDIIKHPSEIDGKSTAPHAAILAPSDVTIYIFPCIPDYDIKTTVLVFPCDKSISLDELKASACGSEKISECNNSQVSDKSNNEIRLHSTTEGENHENEEDSKAKEYEKPPFDRVVFIDSTWNQTNTIVTDERLKNLKRIEIHSRNTHFWRCQDGIPRTYLSTIEAIFYFVVDFHKLFITPEYKNEYDNLLFFFCFMYHKIRCSSDDSKRLKAYDCK